MAKRNKPEDGSDEKQDNGNESEDSFGLPDIEYKPLDESADESPSSDSEGASEGSSQEERYVYTPPVEEKSKAPIVIGIVIAAVIVIAGFLIYNYVYKPAQERARQEEIAKKKAADAKAAKDKQARLEREMAAERQKAIADSIAIANAKPAVGEIQVLSQAKRRYYVVISTAIDDDLVMDYARKLSKQGVGTMVIPPFGNTKFYRLAIADHDTYAKAQTHADEMKPTYGNEVWVVRY